MAGKNEPGGRRAISPEEEWLYLRSSLLDRYRADRRYQGIIRQDLMPLWRATEAAIAWRGERPVSFFDVLDQLGDLERMPAPPSSMLVGNRYIRAVSRTVARSMGLTAQGIPPGWALHAVHDDAAGRPRRSHLLSVSPRAQDDDLALSLDLTPNFVGTRYFGGGGAAPQDQTFDLSQLGVGYGPEHWQALRTIAGDAIDGAVEAMRRDIEARYPARNPTAVAGWQRDLEDLQQALMRGVPPANSALATRLRKLARQIGIDLPGQRIVPPFVPRFSPTAYDDGAEAPS